MINSLCLVPIFATLTGASFSVGSSTLTVDSSLNESTVQFSFDTNTYIAVTNMYATAFTYVDNSGVTGQIVGQKTIPDCTLIRFVNILGNLCDASIGLIHLKSLSVATAPTKVAYTAGEVFDIAGMELEVTYSDDSTELIPLTDVTISRQTPLTVYDRYIEFSYAECGEIVTVKQPITVTAQ